MALVLFISLATAANAYFGTSNFGRGPFGQDPFSTGPFGDSASTTTTVAGELQFLGETLTFNGNTLTFNP
jgi:hypothetical protein